MPSNGGEPPVPKEDDILETEKEETDAPWKGGDPDVGPHLESAGEGVALGPEERGPRMRGLADTSTSEVRALKPIVGEGEDPPGRKTRERRSEDGEFTRERQNA